MYPLRVMVGNVSRLSSTAQVNPERLTRADGLCKQQMNDVLYVQSLYLQYKKYVHILLLIHIQVQNCISHIQWLL